MLMDEKEVEGGVAIVTALADYLSSVYDPCNLDP